VIAGLSILILISYIFLQHKGRDNNTHSSRYNSKENIDIDISSSSPLFRGRKKKHNHKNHHLKHYNIIKKLFKRESFVEPLPLRNEDLAMEKIKDRLPDVSAATYRCSNGNLVPLNDNYCDCPDGGDENLTSACSHITVQVEVFECKDGRKKIFSSRVLDGIYDCYDGSDELIPET